MSLGRRETILARYSRREAVFVPQALGAALESACPFLDFAFLMGSARDGRVPAGGDIDLAVHFHASSAIDWDRINTIMAVVEGQCPHAESDVGILNTAGVIYRFDARRGRLPFVRPPAGPRRVYEPPGSARPDGGRATGRGEAGGAWGGAAAGGGCRRRVKAIPSSAAQSEYRI